MRLIAVVCFTILAASSSFAANPFSWTEYQQQVLEKSISLQSSHWAVTSSALARDIVGATAWPSLTLGAGATHTDGSSGPADLFSYSLSGSYTLFDGGAIAARIRAASLALDNVRLDEVKAWITVRANAHLAYIDAAYYEQKVNLLTQILERLKRNEDFMKVKFEGGQQARWVYLNAKNSRLATQEQLISAKRRLEQARKQMALYLGKYQLDPGIQLEPLSSTANLTSDEEYQKFVSSNVDVLKAEKNIQSLQAQLDMDQASLWPLLTLKGSAGLSGTPAFFPSQNNSSIGLSLSLNLFDANSRGNTISQRRAQISGAQLDWFELVLENHQTVLSALNDVKDNLERLPLATDALSVAQERLDTTEQLYLSGLAIYLEWDQAQQTLTQALNNVLDTQYQLNRSLALLEKTLQIR